jgi:hypothetical protein
MTSLTKTGTALLTLALAAACGGGSGSAKDTPPAKADATKAATSINLVKADFSADFTSTPADNSQASNGALPEDVATCLGISKADAASHDVVDLDSDSFAKGAPPNGVQVSSEVEVVTSKAEAKKELTIFQGDKASGCLGKSFEKSLKEQIGATAGVTLGKVEVTKLSPSTSGTDGAFGFSLTIPVQAPGITINVKTEVRGFLKKHTEVTLVSVSYGTGGDIDNDAIYRKLVDRAKSSAV